MGNNENKKRVLIVDDEQAFTRILAMTLEQTGKYQVKEENHADRVRDVAHQLVPDVIVLDVMMPELDGGEVLAQLRADPVTEPIPVIFMTALVESEEAPLGGLISAGHRFLPKPVSCVELARCIEAVVQERRESSAGWAPKSPAEAF